jgi:hypothetical protein
MARKRKIPTVTVRGRERATCDSIWMDHPDDVGYRSQDCGAALDESLTDEGLIKDLLDMTGRDLDYDPDTLRAIIDLMACNDDFASKIDSRVERRRQQLDVLRRRFSRPGGIHI